MPTHKIHICAPHKVWYPDCSAASLTMRPTWKAAWLAIGILDMMAAAAEVRLISCVIQDSCRGQMG